MPFSGKALASFDYQRIPVSHAYILHVLVIYYCETNDPTISKGNPASSKRKPNYVFSLTILEGQEFRGDLVDGSGSGFRMRLLSRRQPEVGSSGGSTGAKHLLSRRFVPICSYCSSWLEASVSRHGDCSRGLLKCFHNMAAGFLERVA